MRLAHRSLLALLSIALFASGCGGAPEQDNRPNVILVMTDDQGWAQVGYRGDDVLKTPHLDALVKESVEFTRFYASPVCAPTRASLMTGRYNYRTGVVDTWMGRAMMAPDELTIAEILSSAGYKTGIFGKWHLGDNYPMRAIDQGFDQAIVHRGGGIGQPSDPPGSDYFDPILFDRGEQKKYSGYCTDVYFDEAIKFIEQNQQDRFFIYLPTNAPHSPYLVPDEYREPYAAQGLNDKDARIYGMITNIDDNMGRLLAKLETLGLAENTIVIFMTDNGPTTRRFHGGLRAQKTSVYEGGIRVPFMFRWPAKLQPAKVDRIAAHIDVTPTLVSLIGAELPRGTMFDGRDLTPLLEGSAENWQDRTLYFQSHRGNQPEIYRAFAAVQQQYKLVQPLSFSESPERGARPELYDLAADPGEQEDLNTNRNFTRVRQLREGYERWYADVTQTRGFEPQPIYFGTEHENPVTLTRQDWRSLGADNWGSGGMGYWWVDSRVPGVYDIKLDLDPAEKPGRVEFHFRSVDLEREVEAGAESVTFEGIQIGAGFGKLEASIVRSGEAEGAMFVHLDRKSDVVLDEGETGE